MPGVNLRRFDLNLLVALDVLLRTRNVTRAGEELNLTQSAMSAELRRLRRMFDDELLIRVGRSYELTALARDLIEPVRDVVTRIERTIEHRMTFDPEASTRQFSVVMSDYTMLVLLQPLLRRAEQTPGIGLEVRQYNDRIQRLLGQSGIDLVMGPDLNLAAAHSQPLFTDRFVCIVSADNPDVDETMTLDLYESLPRLAITWQPWLGSYQPHKLEGFLGGEIASLLRPRPGDGCGSRRHADVTTDNFMLAPFLVRGTHLASLVPERLLEHFRELAGIKVLELELQTPGPQLQETMYWSELADTDPAHLWLRRTIAEVAADIVGRGVGDASAKAAAALSGTMTGTSSSSPG